MLQSWLKIHFTCFNRLAFSFSDFFSQSYPIWSPSFIFIMIHVTPLSSNALYTFGKGPELIFTTKHMLTASELNAWSKFDAYSNYRYRHHSIDSSFVDSKTPNSFESEFSQVAGTFVCS